MPVTKTEIPDVKVISLSPHEDSRGMFVETYDVSAFADIGIDSEFTQDALSVNRERGTFRGLHFQAPPFAQDTLVRVAKGRIFDVVLDLRRSAPTFGQHVALELCADDWRCLFIPAGFAHGFCTLEDRCEIAYKLAGPYAPAHAGGVFLHDPDLAIAWPIDPAAGILSDKDKGLPRLRDLAHVFP
jgi:dTDP-4-dehydrorhamnose 3,5-epimerase